MLLTNKFGVPNTIVNGIARQNEKYDAGKVDSSVTQLIQPPRINRLRKKYYKDIEKDASEEFWALLGSAMHYILEMGADSNQIVEERLFATFNNWRVSGAIDVQTITGNWVKITDYKLTSAWGIPKVGEEPKAEWVHQLNLQALLLELNKPEFKVSSLEICGVVRDWTKSESLRNPTYPEAPIIMIDIPLWSFDDRLAYAMERCAIHKETYFLDKMDEELPECTPEDRWAKGDKFAIMKAGNKKASKIMDSMEAALDMIEQLGGDERKYTIEYRPGQSVRCDYCGVKKWCSQYQRMKDDASGSDIIPEEGNETDNQEYMVSGTSAGASAGESPPW